MPKNFGAKEKKEGASSSIPQADVLTVNGVLLDAVKGVPKTPEQKAEEIIFILQGDTIREWKMLRIYMEEASGKSYVLRVDHFLKVLAQVLGMRRNSGVIAEEYYAKEKDSKIKAKICDALLEKSWQGSGSERTRNLFYALISDQNDLVNYILDNWDTYSYKGYLLAKK